MQILKLTPTENDNRPGVREIAKFDLQITPDCRLFDCRLMQTPEGKVFVYGPFGRSNRAATFTHDLAVKITREAVEAYETFERAA